MPLALDILNSSAVTLVLGGVIGGIGGLSTKRYDAVKIEAEAKREREKREWDEKLAREARERESEAARQATILEFVHAVATFRVSHNTNTLIARHRAQAALKLIGDPELSRAGDALISSSPDDEVANYEKLIQVARVNPAAVPQSDRS